MSEFSHNFSGAIADGPLCPVGLYPVLGKD